MAVAHIPPYKIVANIAKTNFLKFRFEYSFHQNGEMIFFPPAQDLKMYCDLSYFSPDILGTKYGIYQTR